MCVKERVWRLKQIEDWRVFVGSLRLSIPQNDACALYMTGMWKVKIDGDNCVLRVARGKVFPQDTHETFYFTRLSYLIHTFYTHTIYTIITKKCWGVLLRENPSHKPWKLEIVIPTYLYTFAYGFSLTLPLHFHNIERFFAEFFGFLFDNTLACYLVFASFFPTLLPFILLLCYYEYGLE